MGSNLLVAFDMLMTERNISRPRADRAHAIGDERRVSLGMD